MFHAEVGGAIQRHIAESSERTQGGSVVGRRDLRYGRDYAGGHTKLVNDYFAPNAVYGDVEFFRRFRMSKNVFNRVLISCTVVLFYII